MKSLSQYLTVFFLTFLLYAVVVSIMRADVSWIIAHNASGVSLRFIGVVFGGFGVLGRYLK